MPPCEPNPFPKYTMKPYLEDTHVAEQAGCIRGLGIQWSNGKRFVYSVLLRGAVGDVTHRQFGELS